MYTHVQWFTTLGALTAAFSGLAQAVFSDLITETRAPPIPVLTSATSTSVGVCVCRPASVSGSIWD